MSLLLLLALVLLLVAVLGGVFVHPLLWLVVIAAILVFAFSRRGSAL